MCSLSSKWLNTLRFIAGRIQRKLMFVNKNFSQSLKLNIWPFAIGVIRYDSLHGYYYYNHIYIHIIFNIFALIYVLSVLLCGWKFAITFGFCVYVYVCIYKAYFYFCLFEPFDWNRIISHINLQSMFVFIHLLKLCWFFF